MLADFDSSAGLVKALAAVQRDRGFHHLGHSAALGAAGRLPGRWASTAFALGGAVQAIRPAALLPPQPMPWAVVEQLAAQDSDVTLEALA